MERCLVYMTCHGHMFISYTMVISWLSYRYRIEVSDDEATRKLMFFPSWESKHQMDDLGVPPWLLTLPYTKKRWRKLIHRKSTEMQWLKLVDLYRNRTDLNLWWHDHLSSSDPKKPPHELPQFWCQPGKGFHRDWDCRTVSLFLLGPVNTPSLFWYL